jgi:uncharacterized protein (TIGR02271 family)
MAKARDSTNELPPPDVRPGAEVVSDDGRHGFVSEILSAEAPSGADVRISWDDGSYSLVSREALTLAEDAIHAHVPDSAADRSVAAGATAVDGMTAEASASPHRETLAATGEDVVIPVVEERLAAETQWREAGHVRFRLRTESARQTITARPVHEELAIEEIVVGRELGDDERLEPRMEGDTTIIPVIEEQPVVVMRRVLTKELRITKQRVTESRDFEATVRRTVVETDSGGLGERLHRVGTDVAFDETNEEAAPSSPA